MSGVFYTCYVIINDSKIRVLNSVIKGVSKTILMVTVIIYLFVEFYTPAFFDQSDTRPNRVYFEYFDSFSSCVARFIGTFPIPRVGLKEKFIASGIDESSRAGEHIPYS